MQWFLGNTLSKEKAVPVRELERETEFGKISRVLASGPKKKSLTNECCVANSYRFRFYF